MKSLTLLALIMFALSSCKPELNVNVDKTVIEPSWPPYAEFDESQIFPTDRSLNRAEDGFALEDGRIVVVDEDSGLRLVETDGSNRPFGKFAEAGYVNDPEVMAGAPNGVILEHDGEHALTSDVLTGKVYRVNMETEDVEVVYEHHYGVNTLYRDRTGALWLSQSTDNEAGPYNPMWLDDIDTRNNDGALYRLGYSEENGFDEQAELMHEGMYFANGITMDADEEYLYHAETMMNRIWRYPVDVEQGTIGEPEVYADVETPDNIAFDSKGNLWVASPIFNRVVMIDHDTRSRHIVFNGQTPETSAITAEWTNRINKGEPAMELLGPSLWGALPGLVTGFFFSVEEDVLYVANLGDAVIKVQLR